MAVSFNLVLRWNRAQPDAVFTRVSNQITNARAAMFTSMFVGLTIKALEPFDCTRHEDGSLTMDAFPALECAGGGLIYALPFTVGLHAGLRTHPGGVKGFFRPPWRPRPNPLRVSRYKISLGNGYIKSEWTPLTLGPCAHPRLYGVPVYYFSTMRYAHVAGDLYTKVRKPPSWPRSWANFSLRVDFMAVESYP